MCNALLLHKAAQQKQGTWNQVTTRYFQKIFKFIYILVIMIVGYSESVPLCLYNQEACLAHSVLSWEEHWRYSRAITYGDKISFTIFCLTRHWTHPSIWFLAPGEECAPDTMPGMLLGLYMLTHPVQSHARSRESGCVPESDRLRIPPQLSSSLQDKHDLFI